MHPQLSQTEQFEIKQPLHLSTHHQRQRTPSHTLNWPFLTPPKMISRVAYRASAAPTLVARRGFQTTRAQLSSPYHYPEGPRSNLPFDPLKRGFAFKYWGFMGELGCVPIVPCAAG
ncbi:unnamed protein product [Periconia digitata]|uniref:Uncharacterized protein n=1 Tax=Periconia digitata TaxID=1303443 RepID=A0A9W4UQ37_9PLEO|nr:unnamed protein product [Periconia digitata]